MKGLGTKTLESDRLILRKFTLDDAQGMFDNWGSDFETSKFLNWNMHKNVEETRDIIQKWIDSYEAGRYIWVVEVKDTHEIIGSISDVGISKRDARIELGYCYGSKFWGKGYATEALRTAIEYLLTEAGFYMVEARHISGNPASGRVMEKAGMHLDAVLRSRRVNKYTKERNDMIVYSITADEL